MTHPNPQDEIFLQIARDNVRSCDAMLKEKGRLVWLYLILGAVMTTHAVKEFLQGDWIALGYTFASGFLLWVIWVIRKDMAEIKSLRALARKNIAGLEDLIKKQETQS